MRRESASCPVLISRLCRRRVAELARKSADGLETGGALFGLSTSDGRVEVTHATTSGPCAERRCNFFRRDLIHTQQEAIRIHLLDRSEWVGEWHTHVSGSYMPSAVDLQTYLGHLGDAELSFSFFISLIVVPRNNWTTAMLWLIAMSGAEGWRVSLH